MKRYLSSFFITSFLYLALAVGFIYSIADIKPKKISNEKVIALNHVSLVQQKKIIKKEPKKEPKKIVKKKKKKKVVKKRVREVKTITNKIKKVKKVVKQEKKIEKIIEEKKVERKIEQPEMKKAVVKRDYKQEFIDNNLQKIISLIQKNIKYPKRARVMNIQGSVIVVFTIKMDGSLDDIKVIEGHRLLKKSALKAIRKASSLFPKVKNTLRIKVPIQYTLS